jgi:uncharacterized protein (DUF1330 family)
VTAYVIAQLRIHDPARFDRYVAGFMPVLTKYGGRLVATDGEPEVMEGPWRGDRVVVLAFKDRDAAKAWAASAEYQEIAKDRWAAAETILLLVQGVE